MPRTKESWYSFRRLLIFSLIVAVVFAWGVATGNWHLFPYEPLKSAFRFVKPSMPIAKPQTEYLAGDEARTLSQSEIDLARGELRRWMVPTVEVHSERMTSANEFLANLTPDKRRSAEGILAGVRSVSVISGAFDSIKGWRWRSLYLRNGGDRLLIIHDGHGTNSNPFQGDMVKLALAAGYDVIAMTMPMLNWNGMGRVEVKTWDGTGLLLSPFDHGAFQMIDTGDQHFSGFFISPVVASIDQALAAQQYRSISMIGLSGGGWTTAISAAADDRIKTAVSVAGTLPFFARQQVKDLGDTEQYDAAFYHRFPWPVLYQMAAMPKGERQFSLVYNANDPCCFDGESARLLIEYLKDAQELNYQVFIVKNDKHSFDPQMILELLEGKKPTASHLTPLSRR
jgi:pimeloyl-ACP methyl ester carboxylesterase